MNNLQANICLLAVTLCWSSEIVLHAIIPEGINPFATSCVTSLIGAFVLWAYFGRNIVKAFRRDKATLVRKVAFLGVLNIAYNVLFVIGLEHFEVSTGAFTASLTVVILPAILLITRRGVGLHVWISALFVLSGILLALYPALEALSWQGFLIMVAGCLARALYIVKLNEYAREHDPLALSLGISAFGAIGSFVPWFIMQPATFFALPWTTELIAVYFIFGYFIVAFATVLNIFAQRRASAAHSAIIYSTEIIFTVIWTVCLPSNIIDNSVLTPHLVGGCGLVVIGNVWQVISDRFIGDMSEQRESEGGDKGEREMPEFHEHPLKVFLDRMHSPFARKAVLFAALLFVYLLISLPFKVLLVIPGFTDVRPVCMLQPVYGIFMGLPGCLAFAVGNLIGDIASGSLRWSSIAGFVGNFAYPFLLYLIWTKLRKKPFNLRTRRSIIAFMATVILCALVQTAIIAPAVAHYYPEVDIELFAVSVFSNGTVFPIAFAIPFMIFLQEELDFEPLNYRNLFELGLAKRLPRKLRLGKTDSEK